jgi:hypothetical protein
MDRGKRNTAQETLDTVDTVSIQAWHAIYYMF